MLQSRKEMHTSNEIVTLQVLRCESSQAVRRLLDLDRLTSGERESGTPDDGCPYLSFISLKSRVLAWLFCCA